ncbi:hypothetical protein CASFOL_019678 [Castilleja foliolosa]|uniref:Uncharacterized protein n=1 Tax=Castilleja foliolosa TaxID=1961234 RepID=A0ABD3D0R1_9LAMI
MTIPQLGLYWKFKMGENEWLNGYLEAILDVGSAVRKTKRRSDESELNCKKKSLENSIISKKLDDDKLLMFENKNASTKLFSPTNYFIEEVVNGFDESDLHKTWIKVIATRSSHQRKNRLENMCWRIWHLARRKKQIACDDTKKLMKRRFEREKGRNDAAEDLSELSEA